MEHRKPLVDIHCHLIPGIDDGAKNWDETLAMARMAVADGIGTIVVTPHQLGGFAQNTGPAIRQRTIELQQFLDRHEVPLTVLPGADVRIEAGMVARLRTGDVLTLADRQQHVLLELPHEMYVPLEHLLAELGAARMAGILSHPERNLGILAEPRLVARLVDRGCLMQITAGSLLVLSGRRCKNSATPWCRTDWCISSAPTPTASAVGAPCSAQAQQRVAELSGGALADELCADNPAAVAAGRPVAAGRRTARPARTKAWFGWKKAA